MNGDKQRFKATQVITWPDELNKADRDFLVRLLEINYPDREDDSDGWLATKNLVTEFLYEEVENAGQVPIPGNLILEGRQANVGTYVACEDHLMQLGVADEELRVGEEGYRRRQLHRPGYWTAPLEGGGRAKRGVRVSAAMIKGAN